MDCWTETVKRLDLAGLVVPVGISDASLLRSVKGFPALAAQIDGMFSKFAY